MRSTIRLGRLLSPSPAQVLEQVLWSSIAGAAFQELASRLDDAYLLGDSGRDELWFSDTPSALANLAAGVFTDVGSFNGYVLLLISQAPSALLEGEVLADINTDSEYTS